MKNSMEIELIPQKENNIVAKGDTHTFQKMQWYVPNGGKSCLPSKVQTDCPF